MLLNNLPTVLAIVIAPLFTSLVELITFKNSTCVLVTARFMMNITCETTIKELTYAGQYIVLTIF